MNISIKQLRAFLALAETENFTRASEVVNLSQPAFSALIATLEQEVGFRLFDRDTRKVQLNIDGLHFIELARNLIHNYDNTIREIKRYSSGEEGSVTVAVLPSLAVKWLPQVINKFNEENPKIRVDILDTQWDRCLHAIIDNTADLAVAAGTPTLKDIHADLLFSDEFYLICHKDNVLAQKKSVELKELEGHNFIAFSKGTSIRIYTDQLTQLYNIQYAMEVRQLTSMMGLVAVNQGISITTGLTLFQFEHDNIAIIPFKDISLKRAVYLIKKRDRQLSKQAQKLYQFIRNNYMIN
ncbi:LysR family transcriptional regulator [Gilliamella sp. B3023]|uniref:LysR family transcriptional regulator n=1 Tax=unclassified Gilliamella TaxID=2685620 RepID=UPI00226ABAB8|nr:MULTISPECIES: LysR family transcriptional regulator [unclassified Gilliamella]MCX8585374.1 LysR family transcriptional regulator [Gilliamella sp. B3562]MCX8675461.1 LysR family transcriptional regulator [Gilliamella sp. B3023]MCX8685285.1 LysR family transcriptional regulator [Gilliamella sp. B2864]